MKSPIDLEDDDVTVQLPRWLLPSFLAFAQTQAAHWDLVWSYGRSEGEKHSPTARAGLAWEEAVAALENTLNPEEEP